MWYSCLPNSPPEIPPPGLIWTQQLASTIVLRRRPWPAYWPQVLENNFLMHWGREFYIFETELHCLCQVSKGMLDSTLVPCKHLLYVSVVGHTYGITFLHWSEGVEGASESRGQVRRILSNYFGHLLVIDEWKKIQSGVCLIMRVMYYSCVRHYETVYARMFEHCVAENKHSYIFWR